VQAFLRDEVNGAAEEVLQIFLQSEIGHTEIIPGNAHIQQVDIAIRLRIPARNRAEDRQLRNAIFPAQPASRRSIALSSSRVTRVAPVVDLRTSRNNKLKG
jgi:hypothetical protein